MTCVAILGGQLRHCWEDVIFIHLSETRDGAVSSSPSSFKEEVCGCGAVAIGYAPTIFIPEQPIIAVPKVQERC